MTPPSRARIAIVDDEEDIILFLKMALSDHDYEVVTRSTSRGALAFLEETLPDLICLDLLMPGQTGASLYHEIMRHEILRSRPIIIMSGLGETADLRSLVRGAGEVALPASFLEKPIDIDLMIETIDQLLEGKAKEA